MAEADQAAASAAAATATTRTDNPDTYAGATRFEIELEFVQSLSNPHYLQALANDKYLDDPAFVAYLRYLQYFRQPRYMRYLQYPGPTLHALDLLMEERFRRDIADGNVVALMRGAGFDAATAGVKRWTQDGQRRAYATAGRTPGEPAAQPSLSSSK